MGGGYPCCCESTSESRSSGSTDSFSGGVECFANCIAETAPSVVKVIISNLQSLGGRNCSAYNGTFYLPSNPSGCGIGDLCCYTCVVPGAMTCSQFGTPTAPLVSLRVLIFRATPPFGPVTVRFSIYSGIAPGGTEVMVVDGNLPFEPLLNHPNCNKMLDYKDLGPLASTGSHQCCVYTSSKVVLKGLG